jgi:3-hydroxyisobutyrate dehydrogenase
MRVAVLGTGTMGAPMARNLAKAGHEVVAYNRTRERAEPLAQDGIRVAGDAAEAVQGADVVVTIVSDGDAVAALVEPALGAMGDAVWAQMSTVGVHGLERLTAMAAEAGVAFVDAPVSGTKQPAEQGTLVVLASGAPEARARCAPVFEAVGAKTVELGDEPGAATRMKLVLNAWLVALVGGLAEAVRLAETLEVDPAQFLEIIDGGPLGPAYAKLKGSAMIAGEYPTAFSLALAAKDAGLVGAAAAAYGVELPAIAAIASLMRRGVQLGHGDKDMAAVVEALRSTPS